MKQVSFHIITHVNSPCEIKIERFKKQAFIIIHSDAKIEYKILFFANIQLRF